MQSEEQIGINNDPLTMYIKNRRNTIKNKVFGSYQTLCLSESLCFGIAYFSYTNRYPTFHTRIRKIRFKKENRTKRYKKLIIATKFDVSQDNNKNIMRLFKSKKEIDFLSKINTDINTFTLIGSDKNVNGTEFKIFKKKLGTLEFELFDNVELYLFPDNTKNIFFTSDINNTDYDKLKEFVNKLVKKYGVDFTNSSELTEDEIDNITINNFWTGRTWDNISPVVSIDAIDEENFKLSILGIK